MMQVSAKTTLIPRDTLSERVYAAIKDRILTGELRQGERIPEVAVSQELGVSSTPVREALRLLAADGLIRYEGRRGVKVIEPTEAEVRHSNEAREAIECAALEAAAKQFSASDTREFLRLAKKTTVYSGDPLQFLRDDQEFHAFFIRKSGNDWFLKFHTELWQFLLVARIPWISEWKIDAAGIQHVEIAKSLAEGNVDHAISILRSQIRTSCRWILEKRLESKK